MPTTLKRNRSPKISPEVMRRALTGLKPPGIALPRAAEQSVREIKKVFAHRPVQPSAIQAALKKVTAKPVPSNPWPPVPVGAVNSRFRPWQGSYQIEVNLYLPQGTPSSLFPRSGSYNRTRTYVEDPSGRTASADGSAVTGTMVSVVDMGIISQPGAQAWAGVFCLITTNVAEVGQIGRMTIDPNVTWFYNGEEYIDPAWWSLTSAGAFEGIDIAMNIWTAAYELDVVNGELDLIGNVPHQVYEHFWGSQGGFNYQGNGVFTPGSIPLSFSVLPARTYLVGVWTEASVSQNFQAAEQGGTLPAPGPGQLLGHGAVTATVTEMWITHEVLAP
jgi:hypothetical protein